MKISCNVKQGTSLVKNSSQTVEIKDKTNEKSHIYNKIYLKIWLFSFVLSLISTVCELFFTKEVPCFTLQDIFISGKVLVLAFVSHLSNLWLDIFCCRYGFFHLFCL